MADAAASANPLSLPVAVVATAVYAAASGHISASDLSAGRVGAVDLLAVCTLLAGSLPAIVLSRRLVGAIPDRVHAGAYIALLCVVTGSDDRGLANGVPQVDHAAVEGFLLEQLQIKPLFRESS